MLEKLKNLSLMTKLLYLFSILVFALWVIPQMTNYYANVNKYEKSIQELNQLTSKYDIDTKTQTFSKETFVKNTERLFNHVSVKALEDNKYLVNISIKKEDLKSFHTFLETISLRYYVEIDHSIEFKAEEETIKISMQLKAL